MSGPTGGDQTPPFSAPESNPIAEILKTKQVVDAVNTMLAIWARQRVVVGGVPHAGKTTLANAIGEVGAVTPRHTDDLIDKFDWSGASAEAASWFDEPGPWLIEGVATIRALRKWMKREPEGKSCDVLIWMPRPIEELEGGRAALAKGCCTVYAEIATDLEARGVEIVTLFR